MRITNVIYYWNLGHNYVNFLYYTVTDKDEWDADDNINNVNIIMLYMLIVLFLITEMVSKPTKHATQAYQQQVSATQPIFRHDPVWSGIPSTHQTASGGRYQSRHGNFTTTMRSWHPEVDLHVTSLQLLGSGLEGLRHTVASDVAPTSHTTEGGSFYTVLTILRWTVCTSTTMGVEFSACQAIVVYCCIILLLLHC